MTRFQRRRENAERFGVAHKHCWASYREASDNARGWSLMGYLLFCADRKIENLHSLIARAGRYRRVTDSLMVKQERRSLRDLIRAIQKIERGEPSALNGLRAQITKRPGVVA